MYCMYNIYTIYPYIYILKLYHVVKKIVFLKRSKKEKDKIRIRLYNIKTFSNRYRTGFFFFNSFFLNIIVM